MQDAVLLVDKPPGGSSHHAVATVRRELREAGHGKVKVGHAGTLDPFATGLLLILIGRATRAQRWFMHVDKRYETRARLGWTSSTGDPTGELVHTGRVPARPFDLPTGRVTQVPPAYSAIKIGGQRAYKLARRGEEVEIPSREVEVSTFGVLEDAEDPLFEIECSSGTYVRSLIADLGDAYCLTLRRTRIGPFDVADAGRSVPLGEALSLVLPVRHVSGKARLDAIHGRVVTLEEPTPPEIVLADDDGPICIAGRVGAEDQPQVHTVVGFRAG